MGRRTGKPDTRQELLHAARELFAERGFDGVSLRAIAGRAKVDVKLIAHYFGNKEGLFMTVIAPPIDLPCTIDQVTKLPPDRWPELLIRTLLVNLDSPIGPTFLANFRAAIRDSSSSQLLGQFMLSTVAIRVTQALPESVGGDRAWRANLLASQFAGIVVARYLLKLEPLASAGHEQILAAYLPTIRRYLLEDIGEGSSDFQPE